MNIEEIKVTNDVSYTDMVDSIEFVVKNAFGNETKKYHKYLQDYAETLALLVAFTNWKPDFDLDADNSTSMLFENVMEICHSKHWREIVISEIGDKYETFIEYVDSEIEMRNRPFAEIDNTIVAINEFANNINRLIGAIDVEKLKEYDIEGLLNKLENVTKQETVKPNVD